MCRRTGFFSSAHWKACAICRISTARKTDLLGKALLSHELQSALRLANEAKAETEDRAEADGTWLHLRNELQTIDCPATLQ
jgi:hypothetical protein